MLYEVITHIVRGNLLQAVMSRRLVLESEESALEGYRRLRSKSYNFV